MNKPTGTALYKPTGTTLYKFASSFYIVDIL